MEIRVISRETIKPSSPTPHGFKNFKLSLIDQDMPPTSYGRIIFFYSAQGDANRFQNTNMADRLRRSLSEVLTEFYPMAGSYKDNRSVHCDEQGMEYIEARVRGPLTLNQLVARPNVKELDPLLPYDAHNYGEGFKTLAAVQVTVFDACGAMAVGFSVWHALADGSTAAMFVNRWAAIAREGDHAWVPNKSVDEIFTGASLFPSRDVPSVDVYDQEAEEPPKLVTKRFLFSQMKINTLKSKFEYELPTRVEVVSAFIFKCLINASTRLSKPIFPCVAIDLRTRMSSPLPTPHLGNMVLLLMMKQIGPESSLNDLGVQLRKLIKEMDGDYVNKLQADNASLLFERLTQVKRFVMDNDVSRIFPLSSCCRFPFNEIDFGWGVPTWTAPIFPDHPCIMLMDGKNGDGIEAWLTLEKEDMALFESDEQLLGFTCPDLLNCKL